MKRERHSSDNHKKNGFVGTDGTKRDTSGIRSRHVHTSAAERIANSPLAYHLVLCFRSLRICLRICFNLCHLPDSVSFLSERIHLVLSPNPGCLGKICPPRTCSVALRCLSTKIHALLCCFLGQGLQKMSEMWENVAKCAKTVSSLFVHVCQALKEGN